MLKIRVYKLGVGNPFSNLFVKKIISRRHQSKFVAMVFVIYLKVYINSTTNHNRLPTQDEWLVVLLRKRNVLEKNRPYTHFVFHVNFDNHGKEFGLMPS